MRGEDSDLGNGKESLGDRDDVLHLAHRVDAVLHRLRVLGTRTVEHTLDASNMVLSPLFVWQANGLCVRIQSIDHESDERFIKKVKRKSAHFGNICKEDKIPNGDDCFLIEHVELLGDSRCEEAATENGSTGLGHKTRV